METQDTPQMSTEQMEEIKSPEALGKQEDLEDLGKPEKLEDLEKEGDEAESDDRKNHEGKETTEDKAAGDEAAGDRAENDESKSGESDEGDGDGAFEMPICPENISEEDYDAATTLLTAIAEELSAGAINDETLTLLLKSAAYDRDVVAARHEGEVAGRNMRIDEYMTERRKQ